MQPLTRHLPVIVFYLIVSFGIPLVFLTPPLQAPDENSHFTRVAAVATGHFSTTCTPTGCAQMVPQSLASFVDGHAALMGQIKAKYSYFRWYTESWRTDPREPVVPRSYSGQAISPLLYLPELAGVMVGRLVYWASPLNRAAYNWAGMMYFARLGNLLAFAAGAAMILNYLPQFRSVAAFFFCLPISVHLAASVHYDTTQFLAAMTILAVVVAAATCQRPVTLGERVALIVAAFFLGHAKAVFAPLAGIVLVLWGPMSFRQVTVLLLTLGFAALIGVVSGAVFVLSSTPWLAAEQGAWLLSHPSALPGIIVRTMVKYREFHFASLLGNLGSLDTSFTQSAIMMIWLMMIAVHVADVARARISVFQSGIAGLVCIASYVALMISVYLTWTARDPSGIGSPTVDGVQGRHLLPMLPFIVMALVPLRGLFGWTDHVVAAVRAYTRDADVFANMPSWQGLQLVVQAAVLFFTVMVIVLRYWVPDA